MAQSIINSLSFLPGWAQILLVSAIPIVELRGAIPWGIFALHMEPIHVMLISIIGSILPAPIILLFVQTVLGWMRRSKHFSKMAAWLDAKAAKGSKKISEYKFWVLMIFVAIPLPGTGVWTGCLAASVLEMKFPRAMLCVALGSCIAGVIVTTLCSMGMMAL